MNEDITKEDIRMMLKKYDYYDSVKDRSETLRLGNVRNKNILDIGSGKGHLAILAAKKFNCNVTSIDKSKEKINITRENAKKDGVLRKIKLKLNNATNLSFKEDSFDVVVSFNALHHNKEDYEKIVKEMFRVAKDRIVITEINDVGARVFDEYLHPETNHTEMSIDLKELESKLKKSSTVKRYDRKLMSTFVCEKGRKKKKKKGGK